MFLRKRKQDDFSAEIDAHLQLEADRLREQGLGEREAQAAARRAFGSATATAERFHDSNAWIWWEHLKQDLRYALRLVAKDPVFSAIVVLTLAFGIGANSLIFSVVRAVILRPLAYLQPDRVVQVWESGPRSGGEGDWVSFPDFRDWRSQNRVFENIACYRFALLTITGGGPTESTLGLEATDRLFAVLGVPPALGRTFLPGEDLPGHETVAVIGHALWQRRFAADPTVVGRKVTIEGRGYTVVGVMPPAFHFPAAMPSSLTLPVELWIPMRHTPDLEERSSHNFWAVARLKPGVTLLEARGNMRSIAADTARQYPGSNKDMSATVMRLQDHITGEVHSGMLLLLAAVGLVLLLACANIANLLLSRAESRQREMAVREALGAGRGRLIRQTLTESLVLSLVGGAAGLALAYCGKSLLLQYGPANIPRFGESAIDTQVVLFSAAIALVSGVLFGLAPALVTAGSGMYRALKESGTRTTAGPRNMAVRNILVAGQMALAVMLLVGAGLVIRSFVHVVSLDPGFQSASVLSGIVSVPDTRYPDAAKQGAFFEEVLRRTRAIPGVEYAAVSDSVPLTGINNQGGFSIEGQPELLPGQDGPQANRPRVSTGYFEAMGIRLIAGRLFDQHDRADATLVAIVSDIAVRRYWPRQNPIGKRVNVFEFVNGKQVWRQIVGVVHGTRHFGLEAPQKAEIYVPYAQSPEPFVLLVVRAKIAPSILAAAIRREIAAVDPQQAAFGFEAMDGLLSNAESNRRFQTIVLAVFAALALLLAAIGIYGVMAYSAAQRQREIGVRLALGARPADVVMMLFKRGLLLSLAGMAAGFVGAIALARVLKSLLFGVSPLDPATFATVAVVLTITAALAAYLPGRSAASVDPLRALREE
jgi:putative ABC transport system permease protein